MGKFFHITLVYDNQCQSLKPIFLLSWLWFWEGTRKQQTQSWLAKRANFRQCWRWIAVTECVMFLKAYQASGCCCCFCCDGNKLWNHFEAVNFHLPLVYKKAHVSCQPCWLPACVCVFEWLMHKTFSFRWFLYIYVSLIYCHKLLLLFLQWH